jgi:peptide/nickel transport system permease protein
LTRNRSLLGAPQVLGVCAVVIVASWWATKDAAVSTDLLRRLESPSRIHLLGTDHLGRDVAARTVHGFAPTVFVGALVLIASAALGAALGLVAAASRRAQVLILTVTDSLLAVPAVFLALVVSVVIGPGLASVCMSLVVTGWTPYCRLVFQLTVVIREQPYVEAARADGASLTRVYLRHIAPNLASPVVASMVVRSGNVLLSISALSFLGLGPQPPSANWGATIAATQPHAERAPLSLAVPAFAIVATTYATALLGERIVRKRARR